MKVTVHGPNLRDESDGTYRVHAEDSKDNAREVKLNGSLHPETIEAESREAVIDHIFPAEEYDREPGDQMYIADVYFGESCSTLPDVEEETTNEGEDQMAEPTPELLAKALEVYESTKSYRAVGRELNIHGSKAKALVEAAQAANTPKPKTERKPREGANPNSVDPEKLRKCSYKDHVGDRMVPATEENFATRKSGPRAGTFVGWCRDCNSKYGEAARKAKAAKAAKAAAEAKTAEEPSSEKPKLTVVA